MISTALVVVVNGSAHEFFRPTQNVQLIELQGRPGWPDATMYRHHVLAEHFPNTSYVFLSDADMIFESRVGPEILPQYGIAATQHPGYVETPAAWLPYETRPESAACVLSHQMERYYAGGFIGGTRQHMLDLSRKIASIIDTDHENGIVPVWHDESALNKVLGQSPPELVLSPSFAYPDNDDYYKTIWKQTYVRKLVALDKDKETRGER